VARARRRWMRQQGMFDAARLVFIDETSANTKMMRLYGRCARDWWIMSRRGIGRRSPSWLLCVGMA